MFLPVFGPSFLTVSRIVGSPQSHTGGLLQGGREGEGEGEGDEGREVKGEGREGREGGREEGSMMTCS